MQYIRKIDFDKNTVNELKNSDHPLLAYCNWSFSKESRITTDNLIKAIKIFDESYVPFYVRIFNETPVSVVKDFLIVYDLQISDLSKIFFTLKNLSRRRLNNGFGF